MCDPIVPDHTRVLCARVIEDNAEDTCHQLMVDGHITPVSFCSSCSVLFMCAMNGVAEKRLTWPSHYFTRVRGEW